MLLPARVLCPLFAAALLTGAFAVAAAPAASAAESAYDSRVTALDYTLKLAQAGDRDAMYALAQTYESGAGVATDLYEAARWYSRAAAAGHPMGNAGHERCLEKLRVRQTPAPVVQREVVYTQPVQREVVYAAPVVSSVVVGGCTSWPRYDSCHSHYVDPCHSRYVRPSFGTSVHFSNHCSPRVGVSFGFSIGRSFGRHCH